MNPNDTSYLHERIRQLEAELQEREAFPGMVAHELRSPLRAIHTFAGELQGRHANGLSAEALHCLRVINESSREMKERLEGLIVMARSGDRPLQTEIVATTDLVADAWRAVCSIADQERIELKMEPLPKVRADRVLLRLVFENLLANAVKFSVHRALPVVEVGCAVVNGSTMFSIKDNGAGFDMQYARSLFQPLTRLHAPDRFPGTGLGLALARRIVRQHGGRIWAEAVAGQGATFYFTLPGESTGCAEKLEAV